MDLKKRKKSAAKSGGAGPWYRLVKASKAALDPSVTSYETALRPWAAEIRSVAHELGLRGKDLLGQLHERMTREAESSKSAKEAHEAFEHARAKLTWLKSAEGPAKTRKGSGEGVNRLAKAMVDGALRAQIASLKPRAATDKKAARELEIYEKELARRGVSTAPAKRAPKRKAKVEAKAKATEPTAKKSRKKKAAKKTTKKAAPAKAT